MQTIPALNTGSQLSGFFATYVALFLWRFCSLLTVRKQNSLVGWTATTLATPTIANRARVMCFKSPLPPSRGDQRSKLWLPYHPLKQSLWPLPLLHRKQYFCALFSLSSAHLTVKRARQRCTRITKESSQ